MAHNVKLRDLPSGRLDTVSQYGNLCAACHYRWHKTDGHCWLYVDEPPVCLHLRVDTRALRTLLGDRGRAR